MNDKNIYANYIHSNDVIFKHAKGMRDIYGLEFHPYHELFLFIDGDAEFISETFRTKLEKNSLVIIPKESFHHFVVYGPEEDYHRYVLNFNGWGKLSDLIEEKLQNVRVIPADKEISDLFQKLGKHTADKEQYKKELLLEALFTEILLAIDDDKNQERDDMLMSLNPIIKDAVKFINKNASKITHIEDIAMAVNVSPSYLAHLFKKELHISPHKYLLDKKLIMANRMIQRGSGAVAASEECGFANYSGFYKMYKRMFGYPPSKVKNNSLH